MVFDHNPGTEKLFLVFSRVPEPDLDRLIYSLRESGAPSGPTPPPEAGELVLLAEARPADDSLVSRLRTSYSRDLIIQKVDDDVTPAQERSVSTSAAPAVYVVNRTQRVDSRIVVDVSLTHR
jgi:hypothetical protein